jgi:hypothetical protein
MHNIAWKIGFLSNNFESGGDTPQEVQIVEKP